MAPHPALSNPEPTPVELQRLGRLGDGARKENSGLVASNQTPGLYWALNDSGNAPRIYPVTVEGALWGAHAKRARPGVFLGEAMNVDWEDLALDPETNQLVVADVGNNWSSRESLTLYWIQEPDPNASVVTPTREVHVYYPDQTAYPAPNDDRNYDCEAVFIAAGKLHLLTKHRSDRATKLYRLDESAPDAERCALTLVQRIDLDEQVTGATYDPARQRLAVITYDSLWEFQCDPHEARLLDTPIRWSPYKGPKQVEAIARAQDGGWIVTDELTARLFHIPAWPGERR